MTAVGILAVGGVLEFIEAGESALECGGVEERGVVAFDPRLQAFVEDVGWHRGFERAVSNEEDDGVEAVFREAEKVRQRADMQKD